MRAIRTSGLMSGDGKRATASRSRTAPALVSTKPIVGSPVWSPAGVVRTGFDPFFGRAPHEGEVCAVPRPSVALAGRSGPATDGFRPNSAHTAPLRRSAAPVSPPSAASQQRSCSATRQNKSCSGKLPAICTHTRRAVTRTCAPIFNNRSRIVVACARPNSVPANPKRRNALTNTYATPDRYNRIWFARIVSVLTRSANNDNCSLIRFSISPRAQ